MKKWADADRDELVRLWAIHGGRAKTISHIMGRSHGSIIGKSHRMGLQYHGGRGRVLEPDAAPAREGRTVYSHHVVAVDRQVLKPGSYQRKIGGIVAKGAWKGFPLFCLTLEERATCPRSCRQWLGCYGNSMGRAKRYKHGPALTRQLFGELTMLQSRFPRGFVVRLHILGDFYNLGYVEFWAGALERFPALHVFGYTARQKNDPIGAAIARIRDNAWDRFAIRTSGAKDGPRTSVIAAGQAPAGAILCPAQEGRTTSCATCALCWSPAAMSKPIAFLQH